MNKYIITHMDTKYCLGQLAI